MLTISVKNFGPIAEGSVDLKPLTIFVGPSNTGKSYMATAVHAVMDTNAGYFDGRSDGFPQFRPIHAGRRIRNPREVPRTFAKWVMQYAGQDFPLTVANLPEDVRLWLEGLVAGLVESYRNDVIGRLHQIHGGEPGFLRRGNEPGDFHLAIRSDKPALKLVVHSPGVSIPLPEFSISQAEITDDVLNVKSVLAFMNDEETDFTAASLADLMAVDVSASLFAELPTQSYYLPASRTGIVQGRRILAALIIRQPFLLGAQRVNISALPGVTAEFLSDLVGLGNSGHLPNAELENAIGFIERNVLRGKIDLDESAGLPFPDIAYETDAGKFTIEHTSSMVSELAPLILFLKYLVNPGDLLIFEEPESHLHPAAQRQMARGIVRLVNAGVKVLITTHSDTFVTQINNHLALGQASEELISERGFEEADFIRVDEVGAYLFRYNRELKGSEVVPLEIDPDTGIDEEEFAVVFEAQYNESIALQRDRN